MGVSLVYLGKNDDDNEMRKMCKAIAKKLIHAGIQVQEANSESKDLPNDNSVTYDNVWFCGHSRFVEANSSIRKNVDITDDNVPITSFLQDNGSLEAQAKMNDSKVKPLQQKLFETTFNSAHCSNNRLPDFFGYKISRNFLVDWALLPAEKKTLQAVQ